MALTATGVNMELTWQLENTVITGADPIKINDSLSISATPTRTSSNYNRILRKTYSLAGAATQEIDLASFTDDYNAGAAVILTKAIGIIVTGTQAYTIGPKTADDPIAWFFSANTVTLNFAAGEGFCAYSATTFADTASKLLLTNTSGSVGVYQVAIIGGT